MDGCVQGRGIAAFGVAMFVACAAPASAVAACTGADREAETMNLDEARSAFGCVVDERRRDAGRRGWRAGEALAWGSGSASTPRSIVAAWMRSPGHRRIVLDPGYDVAGFGVTRGTPTGSADNALTVVLVAAEAA